MWALCPQLLPAYINSIPAPESLRLNPLRRQGEASLLPGT